MKTYLIALLCVAFVGLATTTGCKATPQVTAGKTLVTVAQTVDASMTAFAQWVKLKENSATPVAQPVINQVNTTYQKYVAAMQGARVAYANATATATPDMTAFNISLSVLQGVATELSALITSVMK